MTRFEKIFRRYIYPYLSSVLLFLLALWFSPAVFEASLQVLGGPSLLPLMTSLSVAAGIFAVLIRSAGDLAGKVLSELARRAKIDTSVHSHPDASEWLAAHIACLLPVGHRQRYEDEWLSELQDLKKQGATRRHRTDYVFGVAFSVLRLRWELRGIPSTTAGNSTADSPQEDAESGNSTRLAMLMRAQRLRKFADPRSSSQSVWDGGFDVEMPEGTTAVFKDSTRRVEL